MVGLGGSAKAKRIGGRDGGAEGACCQARVLSDVRVSDHMPSLFEFAV